MKREEILTEAIVKAVKNGYYPDLKGKAWKVNKTKNDCELIVYGCKHDKAKYWRHDSKTIIFSRGFAEAFWGDWINISKIKGTVMASTHFTDPAECDAFDEGLKKWQYHQHKMLDEVQEGKDPILYLKKFL